MSQFEFELAMRAQREIDEHKDRRHQIAERYHEELVEAVQDAIDTRYLSPGMEDRFIALLAEIAKEKP